MSLEAIKAAIPHREPFLLIDEIVEQSEDRIVCRKTFTGEEFWYQGHYPKFPITPGVLLCEAAMQAGAVLLSKRVADDPSAVPVATRANNVQFKKMVRPGDTVLIETSLVEQLSNAFFMKARVTVDGKVATRFDFACTLTKPESE
ncbi:3-hydroxyacyl-ACP dehydratase FabZ family protein [Bythopirellula goksoeyrii]|uniref:3-hydroxyacyl-[acyl-carrier-protein] dehydratase FabZ n=1 Tax=Bythopirellula goksoeyrii TaxID=1400387 RepID=A0A5B9Q7J5_9BACT|nr:3-hydroxyacyl-ACP dehydratase FabZ family protein [Bythopirellula goksoeyrii]QEG35004.1 3-hydroxyacyl-[acyl-carrier-protein] dehydratase FabZ [Bythopirellula goksoeyrii]